MSTRQIDANLYSVRIRLHEESQTAYWDQQLIGIPPVGVTASWQEVGSTETCVISVSVAMTIYVFSSVPHGWETPLCVLNTSGQQPFSPDIDEIERCPSPDGDGAEAGSWWCFPPLGQATQAWHFKLKIKGSKKPFDFDPKMIVTNPDQLKKPDREATRSA